MGYGRVLQFRERLRVLHEQRLRIGHPDGALQLLQRIARIKRRRYRAVHQDALIGQIELGPRLGTQRNMIALAQAELMQSGGDLFRGFQIPAPGPRMNLLA